MTTGFRGARLSRPLLLGVLVHHAAPADDEILGVLLLPLGRFVAALPDASHDVLGRGPGHIELLALLGRGQETHHDDEFGHAILLLTGPDGCDSDTRLRPQALIGAYHCWRPRPCQYRHGLTFIEPLRAGAPCRRRFRPRRSAR